MQCSRLRRPGVVTLGDRDGLNLGEVQRIALLSPGAVICRNSGDTDPLIHGHYRNLKLPIIVTVRGHI